MTAARTRSGDDYCYDWEQEEEFLFDEDEAGRAWELRPEWLHPDCRSVCFALDFGACCKYPDNPLVRVAVDLAESVDAVLARLDGDCADGGADLARTLRLISGLLAQIHAIVPRLSRRSLAQLLCPVGRLAAAVDRVCLGGCPWACTCPEVPDRRAELVPLLQLLAECSATLRTALGRRARPGHAVRPASSSGPGSGAARR